MDVMEDGGCTCEHEEMGGEVGYTRIKTDPACPVHGESEAEMAEQEAQEWRKERVNPYLSKWETWDILAGKGNGEYRIAVVYTEADADRILTDHNEVRELRRGLITQSHIIEQVLGQALGYPWYKDDPKNFPDATEADGVCVGDHVAETLADQASRTIRELREELARAKARAACTHDWRSISDPTKPREEGVIPAWCHWCGALKGYKLWEPSGGIEVGLLRAQLQAAEAERDEAGLVDRFAKRLTTTTTLLQEAREALEEKDSAKRLAAIAAIDAHEKAGRE